ncbi:gamma-glutamyl-gamma-aminobutyrate hydrolase family protein [Brevibacterium aurantiacum]|uniref:Gamma-glutamyl-gamma-aminobutyrate hydrolase family protein n=1 Tax=Brevibacterium aurantiacum TaxID=273384 RepID=A0A556CC84_BREAU|nr:gamma-glutamyl-gamma-aminobutyrate hydrolase family protein [Brevibacterium aurantiacum]TSI15052.1 gamma-glutamyl-gamma-aminobutyrate hydrolase family protein [Brevibacterium aurantiacum]
MTTASGTASSRPLIAVPAMSSGQVQGLRHSGSVVADAVLRSIAAAGGEPVIVPPVIDSGLYSRVDGVVLPGGSDIDPKRYGQEPDESYAGTDLPSQDDADAAAISAAENLGIPALFICRGLQLWNVERGGTLFQHWPAGDVDHVGQVHPVSVETGSLLARALETSEDVQVSSYHHQAIDELGRGLRVTSRGADGCVEAVEDDEHTILAVQWHPEDRADSEPVDRALFEWIVTRAAEHRQNRS